jgi:hypothetical protein
MKLQPTTAAIGVLLALAAATTHAQPAGPAFPGNEAVRIVNGKRVVEALPLSVGQRLLVKSGSKGVPPSPGGEVYMIEAPQGLMECRNSYLSPNGCLPSSLGTTKRPRLWVVKLAGVWVYCDSRAQSRKCEPRVLDGPPSAMLLTIMGTVE